MAEFETLDDVDLERLTDRELIIKAIEANKKTHDCVHRMDRKLTGQITDINISVAQLRKDQNAQGQTIVRLAKVVGAADWEPGERKVSARGLMGLSRLKAAAIGFLALLSAMMAGAPTYGFLKSQFTAFDDYMTAQAAK